MTTIPEFQIDDLVHLTDSPLVRGVVIVIADPRTAGSNDDYTVAVAWNKEPGDPQDWSASCLTLVARPDHL